MPNPFGFQFYPGKRLPVVCRDGISRLAVCTGYANGVLPAAVQIYCGGKRRTVSGFIYNPNSIFLKGWSETLPKFAFAATGTNAALIPWTSHKPRLAKLALRLIKATAYRFGRPWDQYAALSGGCRLWYGCGEWPKGGFAARAVLKRLPAELLPRIAAFFDRLERFQLTPPPPPPA
jgi:hypothetical protein